MASIVVVSPERHANKRWRPQQNCAFAATYAMVPLVGLEAARAAVAMPLSFIEQSGRYLLVAMMSPVPGRNLFVGPAGQWLGNYMPAAMRGYPFSLARVESSEKAVLCIDEDSGSVVEGDTNPDATKFFEQDGVPSAALKAMLDFLTRAEQNRTAKDLALAALAEAGVIQPWQLSVEKDKQQTSVKGFHRIDESALNALDGETFLKLRKTSALGLAYAQLMSLQTIGVFQQLQAIQQNLTQRAQPLPSVSSMLPMDDDGTIKFN
jgi:hypothetical protein